MSFKILIYLLIWIHSNPSNTDAQNCKNLKDTMKDFNLAPIEGRHKLTKNMLDLLQSMDSPRNKRQYYLYQQNPAEPQHVNQMLAEVVNPASPATYQVDPGVEAQFVNSPQYILLKSSQLIAPQLPPQIPPQIPQIEPLNPAKPLIMNVNTISSVPDPAFSPLDLKHLISMAAQSAMQTKRDVYDLCTEPTRNFERPFNFPLSNYAVLNSSIATFNLPTNTITYSPASGVIRSAPEYPSVPNLSQLTNPNLPYASGWLPTISTPNSSRNPFIEFIRGKVAAAKLVNSESNQLSQSSMLSTPWTVGQRSVNDLFLICSKGNRGTTLCGDSEGPSTTCATQNTEKMNIAFITQRPLMSTPECTTAPKGTITTESTNTPEYTNTHEKTSREMEPERTTEISNNAAIEALLYAEIKKLESGKFNGKKEGLPCPLNGTWISQAAGITFNISKEDVEEFPVCIEGSGDTQGFFNNSNWEVTAQMPFASINLIVLTAVHEADFLMATFTGECRICMGKELVTGHWLLNREESTCDGMNRGQTYFGDTWQRKNCT